MPPTRISYTSGRAGAVWMNELGYIDRKGIRHHRGCAKVLRGPIVDVFGSRECSLSGVIRAAVVGSAHIQATANHQHRHRRQCGRRHNERTGVGIVPAGGPSGRPGLLVSRTSCPARVRYRHLMEREGEADCSWRGPVTAARILPGWTSPAEECSPLRRAIQNPVSSPSPGGGAPGPEKDKSDSEPRHRMRGAGRNAPTHPVQSHQRWTIPGHIV